MSTDGFDPTDSDIPSDPNGNGEGNGDGRLIDQPIEQELKESYLTYSMSVIISRALPDVRDGLKPSQRRILVAMNDLNLGPGASRVKCAKISGDTSGNYHPHGESVIYPTLVRMAQEWNMREVLIDKQGNFGSIAGLPPAAMRYCVAGDTLVRTLDGTRRIADLADLAPNSEADLFLEVFNGRGEPVVASKLFHSGEHPTLRLRTREGFELVGTHNHPVLCLESRDGAPELAWRVLSDVRPGMRVVMNRRYEPAEEWLDEDQRRLALLTGAMLSEGFISSKRAGFNNTDREFFDLAVEAYDAIVGGPRYLASRTLKSGRRIYELDIHNLTALRESPLAEMIGVRAAAKRIPSFVWKGSAAFKRLFLQAMFEGDGSSSLLARSTMTICYSSFSQQLAKDVQTLLMEFGVVSRLARYERGEIKVYISNRRDARLFAQRVGFLGAKQAKLLAELGQVPQESRALSQDHIPFLAEFIRRECGSRWTDRDWLNRHNIDRVERWERDGERIRERIASSQAQATIEPLTDGTLYFAEVESVADAGAQPVYSIRVDAPCHSFITNGFVSHNTEARLSPIAAMMLDDLELDTVDFVPNYDERRQEPTVLPSKFPNLLVNGATGIAVGMATSVPPHNVSEICDALVRVIDDPDVSIDELLEIVPGPDFPTGGVICGRAGIRRGYHTGRGAVVVRARARIEEHKRGYRIIISEIPYQQFRDRVHERMAALVNEGKIKDVSDIRDESDLKEPVRLVVDVKSSGNPEVILNQFYQFSQLQETFSINLLALVDGKPRVLSLKGLLEEFIRHRATVIRRRTQFLLAKARKRKHTVEGLLLALANIDEIIRIIRASQTQAEAKIGLMGVEAPAAMMERALGEEGFRVFQAERGVASAYTLTAVQADAILRMTLGQLVNLEQERLSGEHRELLAEITEYLRILSDEQNILAIIKDDLREIKRKHGNARRTEISGEEIGSIDLEDLIAEETMVVTISHRGYIKRTPASIYRAQRRGGKGLLGARTEEEDPIAHLFVASTHDYLMFFTSKGIVHWQKVYDLPLLARESRGRAVVNLLNLTEGEGIADCRAVRNFEAEDHYLVMATRKGLVKKTDLKAYSRPMKRGIIAIKLREDDELVDVAICKGGDEMLLSTAKGMAIRFRQSDLRAMGRNSSGVKGISLAKDDTLVGMVVADSEASLLTFSENGFGKRTPFGPNAPEEEGEAPASEELESEPAEAAEQEAEADIEAEAGEGADEGGEEGSSSARYRTQRRGGKGLRDMKTTARNGRVVGIVPVQEDDEVLMMSARGKIQRIAVQEIRLVGRNTQGVRIMSLDEGDALTAVVRVPKDMNGEKDDQE